MRILIADDDAPIRDVIAEVLAEEGHEIAQAASPEETLSLARSCGWDLFLVDTFGAACQGPDPKYGAFVRGLAARAPVIVCTAHAWGSTADPANLGAADIVAKPFDLDRLLGSVEATGARG
jgi:two-component system, NtrC family, nitrogen regulation response regulator NtrX